MVMSKQSRNAFEPTLFPKVHAKHHYAGSSLDGVMAFEKGGGEKGGGEKGGGEKGGGEKGAGEK